MLHRDRPPLPLQIVFLGRHLDRLLERRFAERGLNRTQAIVLVALKHRPGLKALELCPHARVEPANVTRTLQSLERAALLERRSHPTDGRAQLFYLTPAGEGVAVAIAEDLGDLSTEILRDMDTREIDLLEGSLARLRKAVVDQLSAVSHQPSARCYDIDESPSDGRTSKDDPANVAEERAAAFHHLKAEG